MARKKKAGEWWMLIGGPFDGMCVDCTELKEPALLFKPGIKYGIINSEVRWGHLYLRNTARRRYEHAEVVPA
jgi:hypothetical protein